MINANKSQINQAQLMTTLLKMQEGSKRLLVEISTREDENSHFDAKRLAAEDDVQKVYGLINEATKNLHGLGVTEKESIRFIAEFVVHQLFGMIDDLEGRLKR